MNKYWIGGAALALVVSFAAGRFSAAKPAITTVTTAHAIVNTAVATVDQKTTHDTRTVVVYRDRVTHTDGTVEEKSETRAVSGETVTEHATKHASEHADTATVSAVTITPYQPRWNVSAMAGVDVLHITRPLVYGVSVDYRLIGPVTVGVWGLSSGMGGVRAGLQF